MTQGGQFPAKVMGRPKIEIDFDQFEKLCEICCTLQEIAGWFKCSEDTIERRCQEHYGQTFAETYKQFSVVGKMSIRRKQIDVAMSGDKTMLIWLGKQMLGQKDEPDAPKLGENDSETVKGLADIKRRLAPVSKDNVINLNPQTEGEKVKVKAGE